jgi:Rad3-related DNA helicase
MVIHDSRTARDTIRRFRESDPPMILVSPSVGTGYDFPYDAARWQIIAKIPFPDGRGRVMEARTAGDRTYPLYVALTDVVQMAGRVMRAEGDYGETFIVDDQIQWLMWKHRDFIPGWFRSAYSRKGAAGRPGRTRQKTLDNGPRME